MRRIPPIALPWFLALALPAAAGEGGYDRWAILAPPQPYASGLADLLTARLSGAAGIALVERTELKAIERELVLSNLLGANAAGRLALGQRVKADALVVLGEEVVEGKRAMRVVVCDCRFGARLVCESHPCTREGLDELATALARTVTATRERFRSGIQFVIGLSPFLSKDLTHDYDYLQGCCAHALRVSLAAVPGVAVIETEEAHAIRRELEATASEGLRRLMPVILEGEYAVAQQAKPKPTLRIVLRVSGAQGALKTIERSDLTFAAATELLTKEAPGVILALSKAKLGQPLPAEAQVASLIARADAFARLGDRRHAIELREAALLLDPDAPEQRITLLKELRSEAGSGPRDPGRETAGQRFCEHFEYLLRNRKITPGHAMKLYTGLTHLPVSMSYFRQRAAPVARSFRRELYPLILQLDAEQTAADEKGATVWEWMLLGDAMAYLVGPDFKKAHLDYLAELLTQVIPGNRPLPAEVLGLFVGARAGIVKWVGETFSRGEYQEFLGKLKASNIPRNVMLARYGELQFAWDEKQGAPGAATPEMLAEAKALDEARARFPETLDAEPLKTKIPELRASLEKNLGIQPGTGPAPKGVVPTDPSSTRPQPIPGTGPLKFEQLHLRVIRGGERPKFLAGSEWKPLHEVLPCTPALDLFWAGKSILYMTEPGLLREVFTEADHSTSCLAWDGRSLWIGTQKKGILVLNAKGEIAARIGPDEGLPPATSGIILHAIEPGKVCAIGSFGRGWCAMVQQDGAKGRVEIFHEAKRVRIARDDPKELEEDPTWAFAPQWVHEYQPAERSQDRFLLVGRGSWYVKPLLVNLDTRQVRVWENRASGPILYSRAGEILSVGGFEIILYAPPGVTYRNGRTHRFIYRQEEKYGALRRGIVSYGGFLYVPGRLWCRVDPATLEVERITDPLPRPYDSLNRFAVTAHHGLIGWGGSGYSQPAGTIFRIIVAGK